MRARPPREADQATPPRSGALPLLAALLCAVGLAGTWLVAALVPAGKLHDATALVGFTALGRPRVDALANAVVHLVDPLPYAIAGVLLCAVALWRGRPRAVLAVTLVLVAAPTTAEALKPLLAHAHDTAALGARHVVDASWPSGHSTAAMALALGAVLVASARWRPAVAALGSAFAVGVSFSLLMLAWHLPSDAVGGYLVAGLWMSLALAGLRAAEARWPARSGREAVSRAAAALRGQGAAPGSAGLVATLVACAATGLVGGALLVRPHQVVGFADAHRSLLVAAAAIALLAATMASVLAAALRR